MAKIHLIFIGLVLFTLSCKENAPKKPIKKELHIFEKPISKQEKIRLYIKENALGLDETSNAWLNDLYSKRNFKPLWCADSSLNETGESLKNLLRESIAFGVPSKRYASYLPNAENFIEDELLNSFKYAAMLRDIQVGWLNVDSAEILPLQTIPIASFENYLRKSDSILEPAYIHHHTVTDTNELYLLQGLYEFYKSNKFTKNRFKVKPFKEDTLHSFEDMKLALIDKEWIDEQADSIGTLKALRNFQKKHRLNANGKIDKYTCYALNESNYDKFLRACLAIQKTKKLKQQTSKKWIHVDLCAFQLNFYVADSLKATHRIIIGKDENSTPELKANVHQIMLYPYWQVPYSICSKEILPELQRNSNYLAKNNMILKRGGRIVDPKTIKWSKYSKDNFPFTVTQNPGPQNSLGIIKFEFHNKYSVYVHDTPNKRYFNLVSRTLSHGCMRCDKPLDLAHQVLLRDSSRKKANPFSVDSLLKYKDSIQNRPVKLMQSIPIFVQYKTVYCLEREFFIGVDFYQREQKLIALFD